MYIYTRSRSWLLVCARNHSRDFVSRRRARGREASGLLQRHTTAQAVLVWSPQVLRLWPCIDVSRRITPCHAVTLFWRIFASPSDGLCLTRAPHFPEDARTADRDMLSSRESSQRCGAYYSSSQYAIRIPASSQLLQLPITPPAEMFILRRWQS
jgi:hypothetical protein